MVTPESFGSRSRNVRSNGSPPPRLIQSLLWQIFITTGTLRELVNNIVVENTFVIIQMRKLCQKLDMALMFISSIMMKQQLYGMMKGNE